MSQGRQIPDTYTPLERDLERYFYLAIFWVGLPSSTLLFLSESFGNGLTYSELAQVLATPLIALLYRLGNPSFTYRAVLATALTLIVGSVQLLDQGPTFVPATIFATSIVYAGLFVGRKPALVVLAWVIVALGSSAVLMTSAGFGQLFPRGLPPEEWVRVFVGSTVSFVFLVLIVSAILKDQRRALAEASHALALAEHERDAREQAQAAAERAHRLESLGRLAGGVAHDFNNALAVVLSNAELLQDEELDSDTVRQLAHNVVCASRGAQGVVSQLAAFSRTAPSYGVVAPGALLEELRGPLDRLLPDDVALQVSSNTERYVPLSREQLERILLNLVINSRDAIGDRAGSLRISTVDHDGGVAIVVSDDGEGMNAGTASRVFEPFFTTKAPDRGTGLGLAMAHGVVTSAGGEIRIDSEPERGTSVHIWLPDAPAPPAAPAREESVASVQRFSGRALLVEDQADVREALERLLERTGFEVTSRCTVDEALPDIDDGYDLLFTDAVMPGQPVSDLLEAFRTHNAHGKILVCSGHLRDELALRGVSNDAVAFLAKPFTRMQLRGALDGLFADATLSAPATEA